MFREFLSGQDPFRVWLAAFILTGLAVGIATGFFRARKIQPNGFKWKQFRFEAMIAVISVAFSGVLIGGAQTWLKSHGYITYQHGPASWYVILFEFALYFFSFDTWFYWLHRWMHNEPFYKWIHKLHHRSTSPNLLTSFRSIRWNRSSTAAGWSFSSHSTLCTPLQWLSSVRPTS